LALEPIRTLCEKIMSLVRFSYGENPVDDLKKKFATPTTYTNSYNKKIF
jgi:hypothetical protein